MKKIIFIAVVAAGSILASNSYAQLIDEKNVTITMDLQPILQLNMTTPDQIDFVFDEIQFGDLRDRFKLFYGVDIIFVNKEIEKCLFKGDLSGLDLFEQLDVAFLSIKARYEVRGSTIFVNGKSCK